MCFIGMFNVFCDWSVGVCVLLPLGVFSPAVRRMLLIPAALYLSPVLVVCVTRVYCTFGLGETHAPLVTVCLQVNSWSGSIEIGVTALDPAALDFPSSATGLKGGSWIVSGCSVLKDGRSVLEEYGRDLDQLGEGDRVGIQRNGRGELHLWVNGQDCGPAACGLPSRLWAVVDLYGKCTQVTVVSCEPPPDTESEDREELEEGEVDRASAVAASPVALMPDHGDRTGGAALPGVPAIAAVMNGSAEDGTQK